MLRFDDVLYLSAFSASAEGHKSGMYKLTAAANGVLHTGFLRQFRRCVAAGPAGVREPRQ